MLETRQIRLIVTLAEHGNLVRAGRVLGMSPSALTRAVSAIEDRLGEKLFDRARRGFEPTPVCRAIIAKGGELLAVSDELIAIVTQLRNHRSTRLVMSAGPFARDAVGSPAFARLQARLPAGQLQMLEGSATDAVRALFDRRAVVAVAEASDLENSEQLAITPLRRHPLFIMVRHGHPLLTIGRNLGPADVFKYPWVAPSHIPARFATYVSSALAAAREDGKGAPFPAIVTDDIAVSMAIAAQSDALATCTAPGALPYVRAGSLVQLPWRPGWLETNFALMRLRGAKETAAIKAMIDCLLEADAASFAVARDLALPGMAAITEVFAVIGQRTAPALTAPPLCVPDSAPAGLG
jgi:DNA-binding transcriptional LysR family regulator